MDPTEDEEKERSLYWESLLQKHYQQNVERSRENEAQYGKGKRSRRMIYYVDICILS